MKVTELLKLKNSLEMRQKNGEKLNETERRILIELQGLLDGVTPNKDYKLFESVALAGNSCPTCGRPY